MRMCVCLSLLQRQEDRQGFKQSIFLDKQQQPEFRRVTSNIFLIIYTYKQMVFILEIIFPIDTIDTDALK